VGFDVPAERYDRFMGRFSVGLAPQLADAAGVAPGMGVLDVGCGPGALTEVLAARVGASQVAAVDPSPAFVRVCGERVPGADVREGTAEALPFEDDAFDVALACLVTGFMKDAQAGVVEMSRVTRPGGRVAACFWDKDRHQMLEAAMGAVNAGHPLEGPPPTFVGGSRGELRTLLEHAGLTVEADDELTVSVTYETFDDFWQPVLRAPGPLEVIMASMTEDELAAAEAHARAGLPDEPFTLAATAWYAVGAV